MSVLSLTRAVLGSMSAASARVRAMELATVFSPADLDAYRSKGDSALPPLCKGFMSVKASLVAISKKCTSWVGLKDHSNRGSQLF